MQTAALGEHDVHLQPIANLAKREKNAQREEFACELMSISHAEETSAGKDTTTYLNVAFRRACKRVYDDGQDIVKRQMRRVWYARRRSLILEVYLQWKKKRRNEHA